MSIEFNPFDPNFHRDPYPFYHRLRSSEPVYRTRGFNREWVLTRYADANWALRSPKLNVDTLPQRVKNKARLQNSDKNFDEIAGVLEKWLFFLNPPEHNRLRKRLAKWFAPRYINTMREDIQKISDELIDRFADRRSADLIGEFAWQLPVIVIAKLLGADAKDYERLKYLAAELILVFDSLMPLSNFSHLNDVACELSTYIANLISQRRKSAKEDLISILIGDGSDTESTALDDDEIIAVCIMLFVAGEETSKDLIGNGMLALMNNQEQLHRLLETPSFIDNAVEECLRYDPPVQYMVRTAVEDFEIDGHKILSGDRVVACLGAANRDPAQFESPDRFDITRSENPHLAFSAGPHHCLGAVLARLEGGIAINTLIRRLPNLRLHTDTLEWRRNIGIRGLVSLPVRFDMQ